ncbi:unnamed protein product [Rangifer tarandus platyrhynchus]|uniref:Uncharacterized protein n=2 Tax=Rangifer tarandus platyrhynchus TaxID=3082113 RepID=A0ABN8Y563_RANTA|nr:unnamed protein product [Rangifer tarandus platyrhynchus]
MGPRAGRQSSLWGFEGGLSAADGSSERLGAQQPFRAPGEPLGLKEGEGIAGTWRDLLLGILAEGEGEQACKAEALQSGQSRLTFSDACFDEASHLLDRPMWQRTKCSL